jgi:hypothetical protein
MGGGGEIGGGWSHPLAQKWGGRTTPFLAKGWLRPPHTAGMGWPKPAPGLWGWFDHPESHQEKKKKKKKKKTKWVCAVGGGRTTPKGLGWLRPPPTTTPRPLGVVRPPPTAQTHFVFFFFFFSWWLSGWPDHLPAVWGGRSHPLAKKGVVRPPHFWARGWLQPPPISPFFFFLFSFLLKKKKSEMGQNYAVLGKTA